MAGGALRLAADPHYWCARPAIEGGDNIEAVPPEGLPNSYCISPRMALCRRQRHIPHKDRARWRCRRPTPAAPGGRAPPYAVVHGNELALRPTPTSRFRHNLDAMLAPYGTASKKRWCSGRRIVRRGWCSD